MHRSVAEALAAYEGTGDDQLSDLARHWDEAAVLGEEQVAADWNERAAEAAERMLAWEEAGRLYDRAVALSGPLADGAVRYRRLLGSARCRLHCDDIQRAVARCVEAAEAARFAGRADLLAEAALVAEGRGGSAGPEVATLIALAEQALELLDGTEHTLRARLLGLLTALYFSPPSASSGPERASRVSRWTRWRRRSASSPGTATVIAERIAWTHSDLTTPCHAFRGTLGGKVVICRPAHAAAAGLKIDELGADGATARDRRPGRRRLHHRDRRTDRRRSSLRGRAPVPHRDRSPTRGPRADGTDAPSAGRRRAHPRLRLHDLRRDRRQRPRGRVATDARPGQPRQLRRHHGAAAAAAALLPDARHRSLPGHWHGVPD
ncbi:MAG TPA: hypothetical protein VM367_06740 [Pseudonocardia sp.]|nr:hypothetical protein [Pseudonocardia sp.]